MWLPNGRQGKYCLPRTHYTDRWAYFGKGTWWVTSSARRDIETSYPQHNGGLVVDLPGTNAGTVHKMRSYPHRFGPIRINDKLAEDDL